MWFKENPSICLVPLEDPPKLIRYSLLATKFGRMLMGIADVFQHEDAICLLYFVEKSDKETLKDADKRWPRSELQQDDVSVQRAASKLFKGDKENNSVTPIAVLGTKFEQSVLTAMVALKSGETCTYTQLAERMPLWYRVRFPLENQPVRPGKCRAVVKVVLKNEVAILIPCHRVVCYDAAIPYQWGSSLKQQLLKFTFGFIKTQLRTTIFFFFFGCWCYWILKKKMRTGSRLCTSYL